MIFLILYDLRKSLNIMGFIEIIVLKCNRIFEVIEAALNIC